MLIAFGLGFLCGAIVFDRLWRQIAALRDRAGEPKC
jgi:hypothetical protein